MQSMRWSVWLLPFGMQIFVAGLRALMCYMNILSIVILTVDKSLYDMN
jgi:hypothetical protein